MSMRATWTRLMAVVVAVCLGGSCTHGLVELSPGFQEIEDRVKGRENLPAEQVFENIQILQGVPAGRVLSIMTKGFSPALGVRCDFCHVPGNYASDENDHKQMAREMWRMTAEINARLGEIADEGAVVNCSTCHRGSPHPAP